MAECCEHHAQTDRNAANADPSAHGTIVLDPVCGMKVDTSTAQHRFEFGGTSYFFCSARLRKVPTPNSWT